MNSLQEAAYLLNGQYQRLEGDFCIAPAYPYPKALYWAEFYDETHRCLAKTDPPVSAAHTLAFSIDVRGVNKLTIKLCSNCAGHLVPPVLTNGFHLVFSS